SPAAVAVSRPEAEGRSRAADFSDRKLGLAVAHAVIECHLLFSVRRTGPDASRFSASRPCLSRHADAHRPRCRVSDSGRVGYPRARARPKLWQLMLNLDGLCSSMA